MGICLIVGRSKCLPGWFGALMQWKLKFKWVFACVKEGVKACQDALGHLSPSKRWFDKVAQIGPKIKCPRVPGWVRGGRCNRNLGNAQIEVVPFWVGLPWLLLFTGTWTPDLYWLQNHSNGGNVHLVAPSSYQVQVLSPFCSYSLLLGWAILNYNTLVQEARSKTQVLIFEPSLYINLFKIHWSRYSDMAMLFDRHPKFLCQVVFTALCITLSWHISTYQFDHFSPPT